MAALASAGIAGCTRPDYAGTVRLTEGNRVVELRIPVAYFTGYDPKPDMPFVWVYFSYPDLRPEAFPGDTGNVIALLIENIGMQRTRAEFAFGRSGLQVEAQDLPLNAQADMASLRRLQGPVHKGEVSEEVFALTAQGHIIRYSTTDGMNASADRRYSDAIELCYVLHPGLLAHKASVDQAVTALVDGFLDKNARPFHARMAVRTFTSA
ncbi:hypothetical protein HH212_19090 [Massilia forsythiae]|uniref:Uncharacterized protein n=1 Tax=Massilia forsythiae TaxID=2728020 RepID=A0A7Z2VYY7_9BURK|nr:hypothetical protein [Massilia forsythiae]QJE01866.1 hypothetical protein HH212_19090 [Massilia forsythiae]